MNEFPGRGSQGSLKRDSVECGDWVDQLLATRDVTLILELTAETQVSGLGIKCR